MPTALTELKESESKPQLRLRLSKLKLPARLLALSLSAGLLLSGCASESDADPEPTSPSSTATAEAEPEPAPEPVFVAAPLTGVEYLEGSNEYLALPAVQAKIDNVGAAIPQFEMNRADIVWVTRVEGGLTRFIAVWHSDLPEAVGPVRSARPTDPEVAAATGGVFVASDDRFNYLKPLLSDNIYFGREDTELPKDNSFREPSRPMPHNLLFRALEMAREHADLGAPAQHFTFAAATEQPSAVEFGEPVNSLTVRYLAAVSRWDVGTAAFNFDATGRALDTGSAALPAWLRTQDGKIHSDSEGVQHRARNLIVLENQLDFSIRDRTYGAIPRAMLSGNEGVAHIFTDGHYLKANWAKGALTDLIQFTAEDGSPIRLAPGNTWVELMDTDTGELTIDLVTPAAN